MIDSAPAPAPAPAASEQTERSGHAEQKAPRSVSAELEACMRRGYMILPFGNEIEDRELVAGFYQWARMEGRPAAGYRLRGQGQAMVTVSLGGSGMLLQKAERQKMGRFLESVVEPARNGGKASFCAGQTCYASHVPEDNADGILRTMLEIVGAPALSQRAGESTESDDSTNSDDAAAGTLQARP